MRTLIASLPLLLWVVPASAQELPPASAPGDPHAALGRMAGTWKTQARFWAPSKPQSPPMECTATVKAEMIMGGRFLFQSVEGNCGGQLIEAIGVIGHNNATGHYQAASFDNTGTGISLHNGEKNDAGDIVLHLSYKDAVTGETIHRRTVRTLLSESEWVETAYEKRNRAERKVMEIRAWRANKSTSAQ